MIKFSEKSFESTSTPVAVLDPAQSPTLGMDIIRNISEKQLNGDIRFFSDNGFGCIIRIKTDLYRRRI